VIYVLFVLGLVMLVAGADILVRGASRLASSVGISPLVVGLTVVAFGTSAPEMAVSVQAAARGGGDIAVGNVIGSNICNVLLILGLSAAVAPLVVAQKLVRVEVPIVIGVSVLAWLLMMDGTLGFWDGALLLSGIIAYTVFAVVQSRRESRAVAAEYDSEFGNKSAPAPARPGGFIVDVLLIAVGLVLLVQGSDWLVEGATTIARALGVDDLLIGLTIVALGTSLPELATSVMASLKGERDIAVGNVIGSNLFNILAVLGLAGLFAPDGVAVAKSILVTDFPVMLAVAIACLPVFFTGYTIARWEGFVFVGYYAAYTVFLVLTATEHGSRETFQAAMAWFVIPLTVLTLAVSLSRQLDPKWKRRNLTAPGTP
jgi:cation:H+ antiporter